MKTPMSQFHTIKRAVATVAAVLALQAPLPAADLTVKVNVPFNFYVGHTLLPAGAYTVSTKANGKVVQLQGKGGNASAIVSYETPTMGKSQENLVLFHRYADASFLAELRAAGDQTLVLARSQTERRVRKSVLAVPIATSLEP